MATLPPPFEHIQQTAHVRAGRLELPLYRLNPSAPKHPILLLHGASAAAQTFLVPAGRSIADHLLERGHDVWLMDWRGSRNVVDRFGESERLQFTLDAVASEDVPSALRFIRQALDAEGKSETPISVLGHCVGSGVLAASIGGGHIDDSLGVESVVLSTLGLFYRSPWYSFLQAQDFILERIRATDPKRLGLHPGAGPRRTADGGRYPDPDRARGTDEGRYAWPYGMERVYAYWPQTWLPPFDNSIAQRLSFMFGNPFFREKLDDSLYDDQLSGQFGTMHLTLYLHAGQNVRRGYMAPFDSPSSVDAARAAAGESGELSRYFDATQFRRHRVTLVTGAENTLWHRESVDLMYEWLRRDNQVRVEKRILSGYGHQDLYWGKEAPKDVFPTLAEALLV